jgi:integrase
MASVKLMLYTHKELKDHTHPIVLSIIKDRKRKLISTGYSATASQWRKDNKGVNSQHQNHKKLNAHLSKKRIDAENAILDLEQSGKPYTVEDIVEELQSDKRPSSFKVHSENLIYKLKQVGKTGNARVYQDSLNALLRFNDDKDIDMKNITPRILEKFRQYLLENNAKINTISVYLRTIRAIYNKAIQDGLVSEKHYPFKTFKIKTEPTLKRAISKETIVKIKELDLSGLKRQELARDIFLFSFYNRGMNFIDIFYLKPEDVKDGRIRYRRRKTGQTLSIKLTEQSQEIISKYYEAGNDQEYIFPIIKKGNEYNSYRSGIRSLNRGLEDISEKLESEIRLSSYVARHSWATIAKRSGIPTAIISEGLAHDSEKTTQIYLDSFEDEILDMANEIIIRDI